MFIFYKHLKLVQGEGDELLGLSHLQARMAEAHTIPAAWITLGITPGAGLEPTLYCFPCSRWYCRRECMCKASTNWSNTLDFMPCTYINLPLWSLEFHKQQNAFHFSTKRAGPVSLRHGSVHRTYLDILWKGSLIQQVWAPRCPSCWVTDHILMIEGFEQIFPVHLHPHRYPFWNQIHSSFFFKKLYLFIYLFIL